MSDNGLNPKEKARNHIVAAQGFLPFMTYDEGDYPYQQGKYKKHISDAKKELKGFYPSNDIIFTELDLETESGLFAALGGLDLGDAPFEAYKRNASTPSNAETFEAEKVAYGDTELEMVVYLNQDVFTVLPHQFTPLRIVFRNNVCWKAYKLLEEQFEYDYDSFSQTIRSTPEGSALPIENQLNDLVTFVDWQALTLYKGNYFQSQVSIEKWQGDRMPATVAFLQWNWAAIWCKKAVESGIFEDGLFARDSDGYGSHVGRRLKKAGITDAGVLTDIEIENSVRVMTALHRIVSIDSIELKDMGEPSKWEDYGAPNSSDFIRTVFVDEILGGDIQWGVVNRERMK